MSTVSNKMTQEYYGQTAPSQAARTNFSPGKVSARKDDENWPIDFRVPVAGHNRTFYFDRVWTLHKNVINDQIQPIDPNVTDTHVPAAVDSIIKESRSTGGDWIRD